MRIVKWKMDPEKNLPEIYPVRHRVVKYEREIKSKKIRSRTFNTYLVGVLEEKKGKHYFRAH